VKKNLIISCALVILIGCAEENKKTQTPDIKMAIKTDTIIKADTVKKDSISPAVSDTLIKKPTNNPVAEIIPEGATDSSPEALLITEFESVGRKYVKALKKSHRGNTQSMLEANRLQKIMDSLNTVITADKNKFLPQQWQRFTQIRAKMIKAASEI
jgi:hypothetical protein